MRSFTGDFVREKKISLAGKSKRQESREEVLERTRLERERRKQQKLETQAAIVIQAAWRSYAHRKLAKSQIRATWISQWSSTDGLALPPSNIAEIDSSYLRELLFFADPASLEDLKLLSAACSALIAPNSSARGQPVFCSAAALGPEQASIIVLRAKRLVKLALEGLALHAAAFRHELQASQAALEAGKPTLPAAMIVGPLVKCILTLISRDSWQASVGKEASNTVVAEILATLVNSSPGLFEHLASILAAGCRLSTNASTLENGDDMQIEGGNPNNPPTAPKQQQQRTVPAAETLCTSLLVHFLALQSRINSTTLSTSTCTTRYSSDIISLFCVPLLESRCPSIAPVVPRLWTAALASEQQSLKTLKDLVAWVPTHLTSYGAGGAAAALLGNLIAAIPALAARSSISDDGSAASSQLKTSLGVIALGSKLLLIVPREFVPGLQGTHKSAAAAWREDEIDEKYGEALAVAVTAAAAVGHHHSSVTSVASLGSIIASKSSDITAPKRLVLVEHGGINAAGSGGSEGVINDEFAGVLQQLLRLTQGDVLAGLCKLAFPAANNDQSQALMSSAAATTASAPSDTLGLLRATVAREACTFFAQLMHLPDQRKKVLVHLSLHADFVSRSWYSFFRPAHLSGGGTAWGPAPPALLSDLLFDPGWMLPLWIFCEAMTAAIQVLGDEGLYNQGQPLPLQELYSETQPRGLLSLLRSALWHVIWQEVPPSPEGWPVSAAALRSHLSRSVGNLMAQLHERNGRRPFAPASAFAAENLPPERFHSEVSIGMASGLDSEEHEGSRAWTLLAHAPFLVPFLERAKVFQRLVETERSTYRSRDSDLFGMMTGGGPNRFLKVRRGQVVTDAFEALGNAAPEQLRGRLRIAFVNEMGMEEAGVDGGGIFKEFLEALVKEGFDPQAGLFCETTDRRLYPNPHAVDVVPNALKVLEFLGKMLGKALWEGILLELPLAPFFLKKVRGAPCGVDDLPTLDPQLAKSLASLKDYPGDISELGLTFSVTDEFMGQHREVDLIPNGHQVPVTSANAALFAHRVADFRLNSQLRAPVAAFLKGLDTLIPKAWVEMFNDKELQELIGGAEGGAALDLVDLQRHVQYAGGYSADHPVIQNLWAAVESFTPEQQAKFLRFVTSCPRPPLLGFAYLEPPLAIQLVGGEGSTERLPTAATCMNLLKLPPYPWGVEQMREKLLYAVESGAGFELS